MAGEEEIAGALLGWLLLAAVTLDLFWLVSNLGTLGAIAAGFVLIALFARWNENEARKQKSRESDPPEH